MKGLLFILLTLAMVLTGTAATVGTASAGSGLYYTVVDADNDPYSGIYLRDATNMASANRVYQRYMLYGARVELNCGTWGESVGPYANRRWHHVRVASGHNVGEQGWVADRYLNTPNKANQPTPGEPECGAPPPPPPAPRDGGSVYYSPPGPNERPSGANIQMAYDSWRQPNTTCGAGNAGDFPNYLAPSNQYVTTAAGWSIGRLGPVYFLAANRDRWQEIDYILLIDPGNSSDLNSFCDRYYNPGQLYKDWLTVNPNAQLVILSGKLTAHNGHAGIQKNYFEQLKLQNGPRNRATVCNYPYDHIPMFDRYKAWINRPPITKGTCPDGGDRGWHP